jgi:hypothetical protein
MSRAVFPSIFRTPIPALLSINTRFYHFLRHYHQKRCFVLSIPPIDWCKPVCQILNNAQISNFRFYVLIDQLVALSSETRNKFLSFIITESVSDFWRNKTCLMLRYKPVPINQQSLEYSASSTTQPLVQAIGIPQENSITTTHYYSHTTISSNGQAPDQETSHTLNNQITTPTHSAKQ